ncbi:unnamed protein product [Acanthoscelides obtectus]|uniref:Regulatory protein zeste n=1 Tax=Acanthoscelides obtectus TaxID=200917 RepID=A0A9P0KKK4_ACAOB|nr:unnamed protein product [Acanthoscelides obtectus]CAK1669241.1 hypothetical protein AOBTE_LOCUS26892 [Acanthoscelides obtectus]
MSISAEQRDIMIDFMEEHPGFGRGKALAAEDKKLRNTLWDELTDQLNTCGEGPTKTVGKWQRTWMDMKVHAKRKAAALRAARTVGGASQHKLSDTEIRILTYLTEEGIHGQRNKSVVSDSAEEEGEEDGEADLSMNQENQEEHDYYDTVPEMEEEHLMESVQESERDLESPRGAITEEAFQEFAQLSDELNHRVEELTGHVASIKQEVIEIRNIMVKETAERRKTNALLQQLLLEMKNK